MTRSSRTDRQPGLAYGVLLLLVLFSVLFFAPCVLLFSVLFFVVFVVRCAVSCESPPAANRLCPPMPREVPPCGAFRGHVAPTEATWRSVHFFSSFLAAAAAAATAAVAAIEAESAPASSCAVNKEASFVDGVQYQFCGSPPTWPTPHVWSQVSTTTFHLPSSPCASRRKASVPTTTEGTAAASGLLPVSPATYCCAPIGTPSFPSFFYLSLFLSFFFYVVPNDASPRSSVAPDQPRNHCVTQRRTLLGPGGNGDT